MIPIRVRVFSDTNYIPSECTNEHAHVNCTCTSCIEPLMIYSDIFANSKFDAALQRSISRFYTVSVLIVRVSVPISLKLSSTSVIKWLSEIPKGFGILNPDPPYNGSKKITSSRCRDGHQVQVGSPEPGFFFFFTFT